MWVIVLGQIQMLANTSRIQKQNVPPLRRWKEKLALQRLREEQHRRGAAEANMADLRMRLQNRRKVVRLHYITLKQQILRVRTESQERWRERSC